MHTLKIPAAEVGTLDLRATERRWEEPTNVTHLVQRLRDGKLIHSIPARSDAEALAIAADWGTPGTGIVQRIISRAEFTAITAGTRISVQAEPQPQPIDLHPTKTRLALLRQVADGEVYQDVLGITYHSGGVQVTARIREMEQAGWVELDGRYWGPTSLGQRVLDIATPAVTP
jgi:hypothetical protein